MNSFDQLNDALFAQMERLANAGDEDTVRREIERSEAVSALATNITRNARNAIDVMNMQINNGVGLAQAVAAKPKMLGDSVVREVPINAPVPWDVADAWIKTNASEHTASYIADHLNRSHDEIRDRCAELGVEPKFLNTGKRSWTEIARDKKEAL